MKIFSRTKTEMWLVKSEGDTVTAITNVNCALLFFSAEGGCNRRGVQWWQPASQEKENGFRRQLSKLRHLKSRPWVGSLDICHRAVNLHCQDLFKAVLITWGLFFFCCYRVIYIPSLLSDSPCSWRNTSEIDSSFKDIFNPQPVLSVSAQHIFQQRTWQSTSGLQMTQESTICCRSRSASIWESHLSRGSTLVRLKLKLFKVTSVFFS